MNRILRFTRLVAALGLGLSLATTLLASRPAQAEGEIRIAEQFGIVYLLLNVVRDQRLIESTARPRACKSRSTGPNCPAARRSTMRCCPGRSISPVPASVRC